MMTVYFIATIIAGLGYVTSLVLYFLTFQDINSLELPINQPLGFVMGGIWFIAIIKLIRDPKMKALQKQKKLNPIPMLKLMFQGTPMWLLLIAGASFIFSLISFLVLMNMQEGVPSIIDGQKVIHNHGKIIKVLTDGEYIHALALNARMFIGHNLIFFGVGTAILYPGIKSDSEKFD